MPASYPILEYDSEREAIIEPSQRLPLIDIPEHCVICFFHEVFAALVQAGELRVVHTLTSELGVIPSTSGA